MNWDVRVDHEVCMANEECVRAAPSSFRLGDGWLSVPTPEAKDEDIEVLIAAAEACPVQAVTIRDADGQFVFDPTTSG